MYEFRRGDALALLLGVPDESIDCVITDPPYSSGAMTIAGRAADPVTKYCQSNNNLGRPSFAGDNRDQRSFKFWSALWLAECYRAAKRGAYCLVFTDWRQLPTTADALQAGGWTWRGVIVWDKTEASRSPNKNYFRHQAEYVVWGTKGAFSRPPLDGLGPWPGCYRVRLNRADKHHLTGKPTDLLRSLVKCCPPGGLVLDPFVGSGTTAVACVQEDRRCLGFEQSADYLAIAQRRAAQASGEPKARAA
jgi:site-specific DNA-methyltransferase (adenine-specific)